MNYILLPSLKQAAAIRTASLLYNNREVENLKRQETNAQRVKEKLEKKIDDKLYSDLPEPLRKRVAKTIFHMHSEVESWKGDHKFLRSYMNECIDRCLCWRTDGTINRDQTAKKFVTIDNTIDPKIRFIMACIYFLEDEVVALWDIYFEIKKRRGFLYSTNFVVRFWMDRLMREDTRLWSDVFDEYFNRPRAELGVPVRVSCFYHLLSRERKQDILRLLTNVHADDFKMCLNKMEETKRTEIIRSDAFTSLRRCLKWPYRSVFINMAKELLGYLNFHQYGYLLENMLFDYLVFGHEDFHLLEQFWQISPTEFKEKAKELNCFMLFEEKRHFAKTTLEILRKYLDQMPELKEGFRSRNLI